MSNLAASGGYFISMCADTIIANPTTITGSIGVFAGKFNMRGMFEKIGVSYDDTFTNESNTGNMGSLVNELNEKETERWNKFLDTTYADFTGKVALGRNLTVHIYTKLISGRTSRECS